MTPTARRESLRKLILKAAYEFAEAGPSTSAAKRDALLGLCDDYAALPTGAWAQGLSMEGERLSLESMKSAVKILCREPTVSDQLDDIVYRARRENWSPEQIVAALDGPPPGIAAWLPDPKNPNATERVMADPELNEGRIETQSDSLRMLLRDVLCALNDGWRLVIGQNGGFLQPNPAEQVSSVCMERTHGTDLFMRIQISAIDRRMLGLRYEEVEAELQRLASVRCATRS